MTGLSMDVPESFLQPEYRSGYYVDEKMKEVWAVEMDILHQFASVCDQYHLKWFALGGTLLGAIRHQGFVPWDNDIDVIMPREDYDQLLRIGPEVFQFPYFFQCPLTEKRFWRTHVQIRNSLTTGSTRRDRKKAINRGIFIDVMVLDEVPETVEERNRHRKRIRRRWWLRYVEKMRYSSKWYYSFPGKIISSVLGSRTYKAMFRSVNRKLSAYKGKGTRKVAHTAVFYRESRVWEKEDYAEIIPWKFEYMQVNVPVGYDRILRTMYGEEYMEIPTDYPKNDHGSLILDTDTPYAQYFQTKTSA